MARVVIDANAFVSALLSADGGARSVLRLALKGHIQPVFGNALFAQYEGLVARSQMCTKDPLNEDQRASLFEASLSVSDWVRIHFMWRPNLPDEADNHVLELAVAAGAEGIITASVGDFGRAELLFPGIRFLSPADFLKWSHERSHDLVALGSARATESAGSTPGRQHEYAYGGTCDPRRRRVRH